MEPKAKKWKTEKLKSKKKHGDTVQQITDYYEVTTHYLCMADAMLVTIPECG